MTPPSLLDVLCEQFDNCSEIAKERASGLLADSAFPVLEKNECIGWVVSIDERFYGVDLDAITYSKRAEDLDDSIEEAMMSLFEKRNPYDALTDKFL